MPSRIDPRLFKKVANMAPGEESRSDPFALEKVDESETAPKTMQELSETDGAKPEAPEDSVPVTETHKEKLEKLNDLIQSEFGLNELTIDVARNYVSQVMIQLKEEPELSSIWIDRDVHNVMAFIRSVKTQALGAQAVKKEKAVKKETKAKSRKLEGFELSMDGLKL